MALHPPAALLPRRFATRTEPIAPPRENGGNMDVKAMQVGTTIMFPVLVDGAGLWTGDIHFAQGDGEVCGTAIEMEARVTLKCEVIKGAGSSIRFPHVIGGGQLRNAEPSRFHAVIDLPVRDRHDTSEARKVLATLRATQRLHEQDVERLLFELGRVGVPQKPRAP